MENVSFEKLVARDRDYLGIHPRVDASAKETFGDVHGSLKDKWWKGDAESLKTGNAGERLACGVIVIRENK